MNELKELLQSRYKALEEARAIDAKATSEKRDMDATENENYNKALADFNRIDGQVKRIEELRRAEEGMVKVEEKQSEIRETFGDKELELREAFCNLLREGDQSKAALEYRDLTAANDAQAGYLKAPMSFVNEMLEDLRSQCYFRSLARILPPLTSSEDLGVLKKTAHMSTAAWGTELGAPTKDTSLAFGKRIMKPHPATGEIVISKTLIRKAIKNVDAIVREEMSANFTELLENAYFTGDGVGKPLGIFVNSNDGISSSRDVSSGNTATAITFDNLINCKYSVKTPYWSKLVWMFHGDALKMLAKLKDGEGNYIWRQSITQNEPDRLLNFPVYMSDFVPNTFTTGQYVGILGDFATGYWIVDSLSMEMQVLYELYARTNQIDYIARLETDGAPVKEECFVRVKLG